MSTQYLKLVVQARDLEDGDVIPFNGSTLTVQSARSTIFDTGPGESHAVVMVDSWNDDTTVLYLHPNTMMNIDRPDPQAERIERLSKVLYETLEGGSGAVDAAQRHQGNTWEHAAEWHKDSIRHSVRTFLLEIDNERTAT